MIIAFVLLVLLAALGYVAVRHPDRAKQGFDWLREDWKRAVLTISGVLAGCVGLGLLLDMALPIIALAGFGVWCLYDWWKSRQPAPAVLNWPMMVNSTYDAVFLALQNCAESVGLRRPVVVTELPHAPQIVEKRGIAVIQLKAQKRVRGPMDEEEKDTIKLVLQYNLASLLDAGQLINVPVSVSPNFPPWVIDEVVEAGAYCVIHVVIPYNQAVVDYLTQRVFEMPTTSHQRMVTSNAKVAAVR